MNGGSGVTTATLHEDLATVPWPDTPDGDYARRYVTPLMRDGATAHVANAPTRVAVARVDEHLLPVTINDGAERGCYVVSPYNHYVDYAREELVTLGEPAAEAALGMALHGLGGVLRLGAIDKTVHVNNWLLSTNLYPKLTRAQIAAVTRLLAARFPDHAIAWRSVNTAEGEALWRAFEAEGHQPVASRQLYWQRPAEDAFYNHDHRKIWRKDRKLLDRSAYERLGHADLREADLPRLKDLYDQLYLEKYSRHNPQFTLAFLRTALHDGTLELRALRHRETGAIDGVAGYFVRGGTLTTPLFGYDLGLPQQVGLYRMLTVLMYLEAQERGLLLNMSSGAAGFKRCRGGRGNVEATMVYHRHLPIGRRAAWDLLAGAINGLAVPLMRQYKV